jgi:hypothetical protein
MFRFTIRELFLLTLVVALGIGWTIRARQLEGQLDRANAWRGRAGALEDVLKDEGWEVRWDFATGEVTTIWSSDRSKSKNYAFSHQSRTTEFFSPSADPP